MRGETEYSQQDDQIYLVSFLQHNLAGNNLHLVVLGALKRLLVLDRVSRGAGVCVVVTKNSTAYVVEVTRGVDHARSEVAAEEIVTSVVVSLDLIGILHTGVDKDIQEVSKDQEVEVVPVHGGDRPLVQVLKVARELQVSKIGAYTWTRGNRN